MGWKDFAGAFNFSNMGIKIISDCGESFHDAIKENKR